MQMQKTELKKSYTKAKLIRQGVLEDVTAGIPSPKEG